MWKFDFFCQVFYFVFLKNNFLNDYALSELKSHSILARFLKAINIKRQVQWIPHLHSCTSPLRRLAIQMAIELHQTTHVSILFSLLHSSHGGWQHGNLLRTLPIPGPTRIGCTAPRSLPGSKTLPNSWEQLNSKTAQISKSRVKLSVHYNIGITIHDLHVNMHNMTFFWIDKSGSNVKTLLDPH